MEHHAKEKRYLLEIELDGISPAIRREVIVPESISLSWLHEVIQEAMGWMDCHLHQFEHKGKTYGVPARDDWQEVIGESAVALNQLVTRVGAKLTYTYDFGDDWRHHIRLKKVLPPDPLEFLRCLSGERACPPEDCGGIYGYLELCELRDAEAKGKKLSPGEQERLEWFDLQSDEDVFDEDDAASVNETFQRILDLGLAGGGLGVNGASVPDGVFKSYEFDEDDDDDDEDFENFMQALTGEGRGVAPGGLVDEGDEPDGEEIPDPYLDLSEDEQALFRTTLKEAHALRAREPWKKLFDSDIFGIEDPDTGEIAIVSILGANREVFALHVHRPPHGFDFWKQVLLEPESMSPESMLMKSSIIEVEFRNKSDLEEPDLQLYAKLSAASPGRGPKKWALLRNYRPRYMPWFPKAQQLPLLLRGMRLTSRFLDMLAEAADPNDFLLGNDPVGVPPKYLKVFQLQPNQDPDDPQSWVLKNVVIDWENCGTNEAAFQPTEFEVQQLANLPRGETHWELGATFFPSPVMTNEGPIFPLLAMAMDSAMARPPIPYLSGDMEQSPTQAQWNCLKERALEAGHLPREIHVATDPAMETLASLEKAAGIRVLRKQKLEFLDMLFESMSQLSPEGS